MSEVKTYRVEFVEDRFSKWMSKDDHDRVVDQVVRRNIHLNEELAYRDGVIQEQKKTIAMLTEGRDKLFQATQDYIAKLTAQAKVIEKLKDAMAKAASAPGIEWLDEQLELGRVLAALTKQPEPAKETPE